MLFPAAHLQLQDTGPLPPTEESSDLMGATGRLAPTHCVDGVKAL